MSRRKRCSRRRHPAPFSFNRMLFLPDGHGSKTSYASRYFHASLPSAVFGESQSIAYNMIVARMSNRSRLAWTSLDMFLGVTKALNGFNCGCPGCSVYRTFKKNTLLLAYRSPFAVRHLCYIVIHRRSTAFMWRLCSLKHSCVSDSSQLSEATGYA